MYHPQMEMPIKPNDTFIHDSVIGLAANWKVFKGNQKRMSFLVIIFIACAYFYITS